MTSNGSLIHSMLTILMRQARHLRNYCRVTMSSRKWSSWQLEMACWQYSKASMHSGVHSRERLAYLRHVRHMIAVIVGESDEL